MDARLIEGLILEQLKSLSTNPERLREKAEGFNIRFDQEVKPLFDQQKPLQQSLAKVEKRAQRLLGLYEDELIGKEEFAKEKGGLDSEKGFLETELEEVNQGPGGCFPVWKSSP